MTIQARKPYPSDISDAQWAILEPLLLAFEDRVRPGPQRTLDVRAVVNTLRYLNRTGCQWDYLPHDRIAKSTAYDYFAKGRDHGLLEKINRELVGEVRTQTPTAANPEVLREATPSGACLASQSVKTTEVGGVRGYDAAKQLKGRQRHLVVDTLGLVLAILVTAGNVDDAAGAQHVLEKMTLAEYGRLEVRFADNKYNNKELRAWLVLERGNRWQLQISSRPPGTVGFQPLKIRWVVERTLAWLGRYRRPSQDYERRTDSSENMLLLSSIGSCLNQLQPERQRRAAFTYRQPQPA